MLKTFSLSKNHFFYYDIEKKTIARFPSKSNLLPKGSDNSLYFGIKKNKDLTKIICSFFDVNKIENIIGLQYKMQCGEDEVNVSININAQGQIQIKISNDGTMCRLTNHYSFERMEEYDFNKMLLVIDFINMEIRFKDPLELSL